MDDNVVPARMIDELGANFDGEAGIAEDLMEVML